MKLFKHFILSLLFISTQLTCYAEKNELLSIKGKIVNHEGEPMSAVIVEISNSDIFTLSDINGNFCIDITKHYLPTSISFKFVDYFTRRIDINKNNISDSLHVTLFPGNDATAELFSAKRKYYVAGFGVYPLYSYFNSTFNTFEELNDAQITQLNSNSHYGGFGLEAHYINIYAQLNFGFAPLRRTYTTQYRHLTDSYIVSFNVGYSFSFIRNQILLITPYVGINHLSYNEYVTPLDKNISLEHYLQTGYVDYRMLQYTGSVGAKVAIRIASFGRKKRQGIYLSAGVAYNFCINKHPYIFARSTHIHTNSSISVFPVNAQASIVYHIGPKAVRNNFKTKNTLNHKSDDNKKHKNRR